MAGNIVERVDDLVPIRTALISVSDKSDLERLVEGLVSARPDIHILSTGGTYAKIDEILAERASRHLQTVSEYTGQPETQGGLVKTLDFKIYLGLLTETYNDAHHKDLERTEALPIDLVVCNLYPFEQTIQKASVTVEEARANIDIGGPTMIRAAAKNFLRVCVLTDPDDYSPFLEDLCASDGKLSLAHRFRLAQKAFQHTARYDAAISKFLGAQKDDRLAAYELARDQEG
ncbi:MAG: hypothetical protein J7M25_07635 [Deltaproteobacteria bacterium]|nr:hypothetical protein [Deltaproteobacteria bacterium]